jgi:type IV pilus assembly protein PilN
MPHINLLPWRDQQRAQRSREFQLMLAFTVIGTAAAVYFGQMYMQGLIDYQGRRNDLISKEIVELDKKIEEIRGLQETKRLLLARMQVIEQLQQQRTEVVHVFDEVVSTLPEGVYLTSLKQEGGSLTIAGVAQSNARVSTYMKQLDASPWLADAQLLVIETKADKGGRFSQFSLRVKQMRSEEKGSPS